MAKKQKSVTLNIDGDKADLLIKLLQADSEPAEVSSDDPAAIVEMHDPRDTPKTFSPKEIGLLLRAIRERNQLTQRDIANELGYKSANFIFMVEKGQAKPPLNKVMKFSGAYDPEIILAAAILRSIYPEAWKVVTNVFSVIANVDEGAVDNDLDIWINNIIGG